MHAGHRRCSARCINVASSDLHVASCTCDISSQLLEPLLHRVARHQGAQRRLNHSICPLQFIVRYFRAFPFVTPAYIRLAALAQNTKCSTIYNRFTTPETSETAAIDLLNLLQRPYMAGSNPECHRQALPAAGSQEVQLPGATAAAGAAFDDESEGSSDSSDVLLPETPQVSV